jgi:regulator of protease activity HflC (stomatin/prohibitin superfamily)
MLAVALGAVSGGVIVLIVLVIIYNSILVVGTAETVVIEQLGRFSRTVNCGFHYLTPFVERVRRVTWSRTANNGVTTDVFTGYRIRVRECTYDFPPVMVYTRDPLRVSIDGILFYRIQDVQAAVYGIDDLWAGIQQLVSTALCSILSGLTFDEAVNQKQAISSSVMQNLSVPLSNWGVTMSGFQIQSITPPKEILESNQNLVKARRESEALILHATAERERRIKEASTDAETKTIVATAEAEEAKLRAGGQAETIRVQAEAEAAARRKLSEAEAEHIERLLRAGASLEYLSQRNYARAWEKLADSPSEGRTIIIPMESARFFGQSAIQHRSHNE